MLLETLKPGAAFVLWSNPEPVYIIRARGDYVNVDTGETEALHPETIVYEVTKRPS